MLTLMFLPCAGFWYEACGLPDDVFRPMQTLRVWRNSSLHHDAGRWQREGPRSEHAASQHLNQLCTAIDRLCAASGPTE